jgi:hypothetical protein
MLPSSSTPVALDEKEHKSNRAKFGQLAHRTMIELPVRLIVFSRVTTNSPKGCYALWRNTASRPHRQPFATLRGRPCYRRATQHAETRPQAIDGGYGLQPCNPGIGAGSIDREADAPDAGI